MNYSLFKVTRKKTLTVAMKTTKNTRENILKTSFGMHY